MADVRLMTRSSAFYFFEFKRHAEIEIKALTANIIKKFKIYAVHFSFKGI